jgi:prenylated cyclic peptide (anacyclamide/piricyclamide family)
LIHQSTGVADLRYESSFVGFLKPRPKLTFGWVQGCHSYLDSAAPSFLTKIDLETVDLDWQFCHTVKNQLIGGFYPMKTKKLTPRNSAPVQRENAATVSRDGNAIAPFNGMYVPGMGKLPFAGDDAE